jgi:L-aspartate oxidase
MARLEPVVVVGSGVAGGLAAHLLSRTHEVVLLTKGRLVGGSTALAQGGVAAAIGPDDSWQRHRAETLAAAAGMGDPEVATRVCRAAPAMIQLLGRVGVGFDRERDGTLARGREGAHSRRRVVHAGGDATGAHIARAIAEKVLRDGGVDLREGWTARELIVSEAGVEGLVAYDASGLERTVAAHAVVLATGGYCGLYDRTTVPPGSIGEGLVLAERAGAALADLEMVQFHPTAIATETRPLPLATEALRGAGGRLIDAEGRAVMEGAHPMGDLAPRDVVAREIYQQPGGKAWLELPRTGADEAAHRFPTVAAACREAGIVLGVDAVPVTPAAHYSIGGVMADGAGRTTVPGLFAIGECASTGLHGANRLASNSLLEGAVMASECAAAIAGGGRWPDGPRALPREAPGDPATATSGSEEKVRDAVWQGLGIVRDADRLSAAAARLDRLPQDDLGFRARTMRDVAAAAVRAARARTESRGAHWRADHPTADPAQARRRGWLGSEPFSLAPNTGRTRAHQRIKETA